MPHDRFSIPTVPCAPQDLPSVTARELMAAWTIASEAAEESFRDPLSPPAVLFRSEEGTETIVAFRDRDACCWAGAVGQVWALSSLHGVALCFRLLGLVEVLTRSSWAHPLMKCEADGMELHPALLKIAATMPLTVEARFDGEEYRRRVEATIRAGRSLSF